MTPEVITGFLDEDGSEEVKYELNLLRNLLSRARDLIVANELHHERGHDASRCECCDIGLYEEIREVLSDPQDPDESNSEEAT